MGIGMLTDLQEGHQGHNKLGVVAFLVGTSKGGQFHILNWGGAKLRHRARIGARVPSCPQSLAVCLQCLMAGKPSSRHLSDVGLTSLYTLSLSVCHVAPSNSSPWIATVVTCSDQVPSEKLRGNVVKCVNGNPCLRTSPLHTGHRASSHCPPTSSFIISRDSEWSWDTKGTWMELAHPGNCEVFRCSFLSVRAELPTTQEMAVMSCL